MIFCYQAGLVLKCPIFFMRMSYILAGDVVYFYRKYRIFFVGFTIQLDIRRFRICVLPRCGLYIHQVTHDVVRYENAVFCQFHDAVLQREGASLYVWHGVFHAVVNVYFSETPF